MKNIGERENRAQFEGFHRMLYELKTSELSATQFVLIDKEYSAPPADIAVSVSSRQMRPNDRPPPGPVRAPLIPYYEGK